MILKLIKNPKLHKLFISACITNILVNVVDTCLINMCAKYYWMLSNTFGDIRETVTQVAKNDVLRKMQVKLEQTN